MAVALAWRSAHTSLRHRRHRHRRRPARAVPLAPRRRTMARRAQKTDSRRALNRWTAHAMPVVLTAIVAWATWVFAVLVCSACNLSSYPFRSPIC